MPTVRVRPNVASVVFVDGIAVPLTEHALFDSADPVVSTHPWAFEPADADTGGRVVAASYASGDGTLEQMTAAPGERRRGPGRPPKAA